jgi:hypothetical protein
VANEVYYSGLSGNARLAAILNQAVVAKLTDTASLVNHPSIMQLRSMNGSGSTVVQVPVVSWGANAMASVAENASASNTALTATNVNITIARQALRRQISDLAQLTSAGLALDATIDNLAVDMVAAYNKRVTAMIGALASGFSASVGSTGVDLTVANFYAAIFGLQLNSADGQFTAILHPQQINDLITSLRSETGPGQYLATSQDQVQAKGPGYRGNLFGVDLFASANGVASANAGADYLGMMIAPGAIGVATATAAPIMGSTTVIPQSPIVVEFERDASNGSTIIVGSAFVGVGEIDDLKGVGILSDL